MGTVVSSPPPATQGWSGERDRSGEIVCLIDRPAFNSPRGEHGKGWPRFERDHPSSVGMWIPRRPTSERRGGRPAHNHQWRGCGVGCVGRL